MLTEGILLLNQKFATEYFGKVDYYTNPANAGKIDDFFKNHFEAKIAKSKDIYTFDGVNARIRIEGPMSPDGPDLFDIFFGYGGVSFRDIIDAVELAAEDVDPKEGKVFFDMNTPGSTVDGVDATFQAISKLSETHHTVAINHGLIASGGMWISSGMRDIDASNPVAFTGSIGVIVAGYDITEMLENMGVKKVVITNHEASEKFADIGTDEGKAVIQRELQAIYDVFKSRVLIGRKKMTEEAIDNLKGSVQVASEALKIGLIDSISGVDIKTPAVAGTPKQEASIMNLTELLAANPEAKREHENLIATARSEGETAGKTAGREEGKDEMKAVYAVTMPIISSPHYPDAVKTRVTEKAQAGDIEAVKDYVSMYDMTAEGVATAKAIEEAGKDTPPEAPGKVAKPDEAGLIGNDDVTAAADKIKEA
jgi:ClpP class serine protease